MTSTMAQWLTCFVRTGGAAIAVAAAGLVAHVGAAPVDVQFQVDQPTSTLSVRAEARGFDDTDTKNLTGTINATLDFGTGGDFPMTAGLTFTDAAVTPVAPFQLRLGLPAPLPGVDIVATGIVAGVATPAPPGVMTKTAGTDPAYQFDASQYMLVVDEGVITVSGLVSGSQNLADDPVEGASPSGTLGSLILTPAGASGPYTLLNAALTFPVQISQTTTFGDPPEEVQLDLTGSVTANASFYVALSGVPGDFNQDNRVDDADFAAWESGFGMSAGATLADGDADADGDVDGRDFLVWQRQYGTAPPPITMAAAVPEAQAAFLLACGLGWLAHRRRDHSSVAM